MFNTKRLSEKTGNVRIENVSQPLQQLKTELPSIRDQIAKNGSKGTMQIGGVDEAESK